MANTTSRWKPNRLNSHMISYRADIDGLRGIAVLAVVFYHLEFGVLHGGFVGVDVFFVISGFLITAIIQREIQQGRFGYSSFYQRRIRRLFPALFVFLAFTLLGGIAILLPSDLAVLGRTTAATVLFGSNFYLWRTSGYFEGTAELNPLLHTWSLAVEEQFYIGLPILLLFLHRYANRALRPALILVGLLSLAVCVWAQPHRPTAVFFLAPFRAWELIVGAALAVGIVPVLRLRWQRELVSTTGAALLAYSVLAIEPGPGFPGWIATVPVLGAAALIHSGASGDSVLRRLLSWRPLVYVGLISYSLYLWHWPFIVYAKYLNGLDPLGAWRWGILFLSVGVSALSLHYVETPFRRGTLFRGPRLLFSGAAVATALTATVGLSLAISGGLSWRFPPEIIALDRERDPEIPFLECMDRPIDSHRRQDMCHVGVKNVAPSVLIWGDSHALAWLPAVDAVLQDNGTAGIFAGQSACAPLIEIRNPANPHCYDHNSQVKQLLLADKQLRLVVLMASWPSYSWDGGKYRIESTTGEVGNSRVFPRAMANTLRLIARAGRVAWLIGPTPGAPSEAPLRMALARRNHNGNLSPISTATFEEARRSFTEAVATLPASSTVFFTDPSPWLCDDHTCRFETNGMPLYRDGGHLNLRGAAYLQPFLAKAFAKVMKRVWGSETSEGDHAALVR